MLYYNQIGQKEDKYALNFNGSSQYLQSRTTSQGGKDFVQWDRGQAWTMMAVITPSSLTGAHCIYGTSNIFFERGLYCWVNNGSVLVYMKNTATATPNGVIYLRAFANAIASNTKVAIQVTYDGSSTVQGFNFYVNGVPITNIQTLQNDLSTETIINSSNSFILGRRWNDLPYTGTLQHFSFANYVKSSSELTEDFNSKKQSKGTGEWLLAPVEPLYTDKLDKQIKSLSTTSINNPLPNNDAFVNEQGYKLNLINYPTTLVKGTDLIKL